MQNSAYIHRISSIICEHLEKKRKRNADSLFYMPWLSSMVSFDLPFNRTWFLWSSLNFHLISCANKKYRKIVQIREFRWTIILFRKIRDFDQNLVFPRVMLFRPQISRGIHIFSPFWCPDDVWVFSVTSGGSGTKWKMIVLTTLDGECIWDFPWRKMSSYFCVWLSVNFLGFYGAIQP